jgi:hypothetical protein
MPAAEGLYQFLALYEFDSFFGRIDFHGAVPTHIPFQKIQIVLFVNNPNILFIHLIKYLFKHYPVIVDTESLQKAKAEGQVL